MGKGAEEENGLTKKKIRLSSYPVFFLRYSVHILLCIIICRGRGEGESNTGLSETVCEKNPSRINLPIPHLLPSNNIHIYYDDEEKGESEDFDREKRKLKLWGVAV